MQAENEETRAAKSDVHGVGNGGSLKDDVVGMDSIPDAAFELSLRDLAELPRLVSSMEENQSQGRDVLVQKPTIREGRKKMMGARNRNLRSQSVDIRVGLFKGLFPVSLAASKKRLGISGSSSVSGKLGELKRNCSADSDGNISRRMRGCSPFFHRRN